MICRFSSPYYSIFTFFIYHFVS